MKSGGVRKQQLGRRRVGVACENQEGGIWGPVRNGLASSGDPKQLGAITWAGARGWTLQGKWPY